MDFPSFGDAAAYDELGRACARALAGRGSPAAACYHPVRPPGAALLMAAPHLLARDPVDARYVALALNMLFFALAVVALARVLIRDRGLLAGWAARGRALAALAFVVLLLQFVSHIPVRLCDLPALALFTCAVAAGAGTLKPGGEARARRRGYALAGLLASLAVLLKISQFPFSLVLLAALLALDRSGAAERLRSAGAFLAGFSPAALQFVNVWAHTGSLWLYDREYMRVNFSYPGREWGIEAVIHALPSPNAYLTQVTTAISYPTLLALRLYRGVFGFEWAAYHGEAWRAAAWTLASWEWAAAWLLVLAYAGGSAWAAWRAPASLRLLNAVGVATALITAVVEHTELRYYIFPRAVLWITLAWLGLEAGRRLRQGRSPGGFVSWRWPGSAAGPPPLPERMDAVRALHIGGYWRGPNDVVRQMMLGLRAAGAEVLEVNTDERPELLDTEGRHYARGTTCPVWVRVEHLREELRRLRPNLVICNAGGLGLRPVDAARLRRRALLLGIALSDPDGFEPSTRFIAPHFDVFLTSSPECVPRYQALGVRSAVLPIATNEEFFHPVPPRPQMRCDVLVLARAHRDRIEPVRALVDRFETHVYGEGWDEHGIASRGLVFGDDLLAALSSARMSVVFFLTPGGHRLVKVGLFDFAAAGALVLTNRADEVAPYLRYGEEIVGFESTAELVERVGYYLAHPEEAERIRRAGRERVLRDHTWKVAWPRTLELVRALRRPAPGPRA